jgi:hypothetical protein
MMDSLHKHNLKQGLAGSKWASQTHTTPSTPNYRTNFSPTARSYNTSPTRKTTSSFGGDWDWDCTACGFDNFGFREVCLRCQKPKDSADVPGLSVGHGLSATGSGYATPATLEHDATMEGTTSKTAGGLAMSRWAPRNRAASQKYGDKTWTRVSIPVPNVPRSLRQY